DATDHNILVAWPWRDWVVKAYNHNMTYDQFTVRQIAGDLLPSATVDDRIATGFNRNDMDGGGDAPAARNESLVDRVSTVGTTWLGLTVGCARCHDHKYDPIKQKDFYSLYGFFNDQAEGKGPLVRLASSAQQQRARALRGDISTALGLLPEKT